MQFVVHANTCMCSAPACSCSLHARHFQCPWYLSNLILCEQLLLVALKICYLTVNTSNAFWIFPLAELVLFGNNSLSRIVGFLVILISHLFSSTWMWMFCFHLWLVASDLLRLWGCQESQSNNGEAGWCFWEVEDFVRRPPIRFIRDLISH